MSRDENVLRYSKPEDYDRNKSEWVVRFIYVASGRMFSRNQVRRREQYLLRMAKEEGFGKHCETIMQRTLVLYLVSTGRQRPIVLDPLGLSVNRRADQSRFYSDYRVVNIRVFVTGNNLRSEGVLLLGGNDAVSSSYAIGLSRYELEEKGVSVVSNQPMQAPASITLSRGGRLHCVGFPHLIREGGTHAEDATLWSYGLRVPQTMLREIEESRKHYLHLE